jgi:predicted Rossmann-fold nucleotide-binding protein
MINRPEVIESLYTILDGSKVPPMRSSKYKDAQNEVRRLNLELDKARMEFLLYDLARFYRVVIWGGSRFDGGDEEFQFVRDLSRAFVANLQIETADKDLIGVDIMSGGGPGIMRAAHEGTLLAIEEAKIEGRTIKSKNIGVKIKLPNKTEDDSGLVHFSTMHMEFCSRLQEFLDKSRAAYNAPGGIGTLLELSMILQLRQVGHVEKDYPIIAHPTWLPVIEEWNNEMYHKRLAQGRRLLIDPSDLNLIKISDNIEEIVSLIGESFRSWYRDIRSKVRIIHDTNDKQLFLPGFNDI